MLACFAGSGSADLRMILGAVAILCVSGGIAALANIFLLLAMREKNSTKILDLAFLAAYVGTAAMMYTGWFFEKFPDLAIVGMLGIIVAPVCALSHCSILALRFVKSLRIKKTPAT